MRNVLVDGKEFFGKDPTIATRNLPAAAIKQVDVYDKQSDMAEFTGIPDGEDERTVDLRLKERPGSGISGGRAGASAATSTTRRGSAGPPRTTRATTVR